MRKKHICIVSCFLAVCIITVNVSASVPSVGKYKKIAGATVPAVKSVNGLSCNSPCGIASSGNKMYCAMTGGNSDGSKQVVLQKFSSYASEKPDDIVLLRGYYNHPNDLTTDSKSLYLVDLTYKIREYNISNLFSEETASSTHVYNWVDKNGNRYDSMENPDRGHISGIAWGRSPDEFIIITHKNIGASAYKAYLVKLNRTNLTFQEEKSFEIPTLADISSTTYYAQGGCTYKDNILYISISKKVDGKANNYCAVLTAELDTSKESQTPNVELHPVAVGTSSVFELESVTINTSRELIGFVRHKGSTSTATMYKFYE